MSRTTLINALCVLVMALVLGTAHLWGPSELEAMEAVADERRAAPVEMAELKRAEAVSPAAMGSMPSRLPPGFSH
ncbi:hypothetical protein [Curvibacter lanceolatus]|uniref:hypothetical protein n=1 Tax=Curvibacter lanceolatus TaxID=86182 RepID=UPI000367E0A7|nr:hypothetical protein [Curvibacter lanceolatus]